MAPAVCIKKLLRSITLSFCPLRFLGETKVSASKGYFPRRIAKYAKPHLCKRLLHVLESGPCAFSWISGLWFILDVGHVFELDLLQQLHRLCDRRRALTESLLCVLRVFVAIFDVQAYYAVVVLADERHRIESGRVEMPNVQVDAQILRGTLERIHEIIRGFKLLSAIAFESLKPEPMIVKPEFDLVFLAPLIELRDNRLLHRSGHHVRPQQQRPVESAVEIVVI